MTQSTKRKRRLGRPRKGERGDTREELLDAALELFAKKGYAATTVRQIADVVGIRDSAIYGHFEGKQALLDELISRSSLDLGNALDLDLEELSEQHPSEVLPILADRLAGSWDHPRARMMISMIAREGLEGVADVVDEIRQPLLRHMRRWVRASWLREDVSAEDLAWELVTPLTAVRLLHLHAGATKGERQLGRDLIRRHIDYFLLTSAPVIPP